MKRLAKVGAFVLLVGIFFSLVGFSKKGFQDVALVSGKPKVIDQQNNTKTKTLPAFKNIQLDTSDYLVKIKSGTHYQVKVSGVDATLATTKVTNGTLTVKQPARTTWPVISFHTNDEPEIEITVPKTAKLTAIQSRNNGGLHLAQVTVNKLIVDTRNSNIRIFDSKLTDSISIYTTNGDIQVENSQLNNPIMTADSGDISLKFDTLTAGTFKLKNGDFEATNTRTTGVTTITNQSGDNEIKNADRAIGYIVKTQDGDNQLFDQKTDDDDSDNPETLQHNETAADRIELTNTFGDNIIW